MTLQLDPTNSDCLFECTFLLSETLSYIWDKRQVNKKVEIAKLKSTIRAKIELLKKSKYKSNGVNLLTIINLTDFPPAGDLPDAPLA